MQPIENIDELAEPDEPDETTLPDEQPEE